MLLAHAFGARYDLPIPLTLFVVGGGLVVVLSFLLVLNRNVVSVPVEGDAEAGASPSGPASVIAGTVAVLVTVALAWVGLVGSQEIAENILPTVFWLLVWIAVPLSCGLVGDWTRAVNPFAALARLGDSARLRQMILARPTPWSWPRGVGWWPAVLLYFALACGELIYNATATRPQVIAIGLIVYALLSLVAGMAFGPAWVSRGEVFSVLFATWGRLGYFRFTAVGRRGFGGGLAARFSSAPSRIVFVLLLLISVNFDGLLATPAWTRFERTTLGPSLSGLDGLRLATFLLLVVVVTGVFGVFAYAAARAGGRPGSPRVALARLLPSLLPIAFAYLLAHNLQYVLVNGQLLAPLIGNPIGSDSWPVHLPFPFNDDFEPHPTFLPSAVYWYVGVAAIVGAHVLAVVLAHRHLAGREIDDRTSRRGEYPWLVAMVAYTMASLVLIAQPLTEAKPAAGTASASGPPVRAFSE